MFKKILIANRGEIACRNGDNALRAIPRAEPARKSQRLGGATGALSKTGGMRMGAGAYALTAGLAALSSCTSEDGPVTPVHLSTTNPDSNGPAVADFIDQTCLRAMNDPDAFLAALRRSGWTARQKQKANRDTPLAVWATEHSELIYSMRPQELPTGKAWDCSLVVNPDAAPSPQRMRDALLPFIRHRTLDTIEDAAPDFAWQWRPFPFKQRSVTISASTSSEGTGNQTERPGLFIHLSSIELDPVRSLLRN